MLSNSGLLSLLAFLPTIAASAPPLSASPSPHTTSLLPQSNYGAPSQYGSISSGYTSSSGQNDDDSCSSSLGPSSSSSYSSSSGGESDDGDIPPRMGYQHGNPAYHHRPRHSFFHSGTSLRPTPLTGLASLSHIPVIPMRTCGVPGGLICRGEKGYAECTNGAWEYHECAPGTRCQTLSATIVQCALDHHGWNVVM